MTGESGPPDDGPKRPDSCSGCGFKDAADREGWLTCRRHAPGPGEREFTRSRWPHVRKTALCGAGVRIIDRQWLRCFDCIHWVWPLPEGHTGGRQHKSKEWWDGAGLCTIHAPRPGTEEGERVYWRVTHETEDGCGDGEPKDQADPASTGLSVTVLVEAPE